MLFSGYQLGIHLLNSTFADVSFDRESVIKNREDVTITEAYLQNRVVSRNSAFVVTGNFKGNLEKVLIKQPRFDDENYISSSLNEAYVLSLFKAAGFNELDTLIGYDQFQHLLFQRFVAHVDFDTDTEPTVATMTSIATDLARLFSDVHAISPATGWTKGALQDRFGYRKPLLLVTTVRDFEEMRIGTLLPQQKQVIDLLANDNYALLGQIRALPWSQTALIHFDFKLANVLFRDAMSVDTIIDWEMADVGDVCWDIASVWLELIRPYMYGEASPDVLLAASLVPLQAFMTAYRRVDTNPVSELKIRQLLGVLLLQKHFYCQLDEGMGVEKTDQWLVQAEALITDTPTTWFFQVGTQNNLPAQLTIPPSPPAANHPSEDPSRMGTMKDIDELATQLVYEYKKGLPKPDADLPLVQYIYKWFNGNLGKSVDAADLEELAATPKVGKETMLDDLWWLVEGYSKNKRITIRKNSERRSADPGAFIYQQHDARTSPRLALRSFVKLQFPRFVVIPNDARESSNDFWLFGNQLIRQDVGNWVRFYVNLKRDANGIQLFADLVSEKLNERCIPFELKLRNALASYTRTDVAILFMHRQHVTAALDTIAYVYNQLKKGDYLGTGTPKFTKRIKNIDAIGFAENPSESSVSFGMWRSQLIADSIGSELANPLVTPAGIKAKIVADLKSKNFNVYELYRNPYPDKNEYKYRFDLLEKKLNDPPLLDSSLNASVQYMPKLRFLRAARTVGFMLCREAVWYGSHCTWFCFKKDEEGKGYFATASETDLLGIALFLSQLAILCPQDAIFEDSTLGIMNSKDLDSTLGIVNRADRLKMLKNGVVEKLKAKSVQTVKSDTPSTLNSITDANLFSEELITLNSESAFFADSLIERFIDKGIPFPNGYSDTFEDTTRTEFNPTLTHGLTALGYFFLLLSDNKDKPVVPLTEIYGSQIPIVLPTGNILL